MVTRFTLLESLARLVKDELVVTNLKGTAHEWHYLSPKASNLYYLGMGMVTPAAIGLALSLPDRRVAALDGDGSILLDLAVIPTVADIAPQNLSVFVFDNESYESNGGLPTQTSNRVNLAGIAKASGIKSTFDVSTVTDFQKAARIALKTRGPHFILAKVTRGTKDVPITMTYGKYNTYQFVKHIEKTTGAKILQSIKASGRSYSPTKGYFAES